jgi:hypothetical protein
MPKAQIKYTLKRFKFSRISTIGMLFREREFFCYTLEDMDRGLNELMTIEQIKFLKEPKFTAIPEGTYNVKITYSNRFRHNLPLIEDVKGFTGIRIHKGNFAKDTEGCILLGHSAGSEFVNESSIAFLKFFDQLEIDLKKSVVSLTIQSLK